VSTRQYSESLIDVLDSGVNVLPMFPHIVPLARWVNLFIIIHPLSDLTNKKVIKS